MAGHRHSLASNQEELFRSSVCYQTDMQYWNTVARGEIVGVVLEYRNSMSTLEQTIRERVEAGLVDPQELLMVEVKKTERNIRINFGEPFSIALKLHKSNTYCTFSFKRNFASKHFIQNYTY